MEYSHGNDISKWQLYSPYTKSPNFTLAEERGIKLVCVKKSQGKYQDPAFRVSWNALKLHQNIKRTIYHWFDPTISASAQIGAIVKDLDPADITAPMWLDVEQYHYMPKNIVMGRMLEVLYAMRAFSCKPVAIYTNKYKFETYYSNKTGWDREWFLVVANYGPANPIIPAGWGTWNGWQYSCDGNKLGRFYGYASSSVDMDLLKPELLEG